MIQDKQISRDLFYREVWNSIEAFLIKHPSKILHPHQRQRLLKGLSRYLEDDYGGPRYIEVDFQDRTPNNPFASLEEIEEEALLLPMSIEENNNQTLEVTEKIHHMHSSDDLYHDSVMISGSRPIIETNKQSESYISEIMSKSIQQKVMEAQQKRITRSKAARMIKSNVKFEDNSKNQMKIEEQLLKYPQIKASISLPKRFYEESQQSQINDDQSQSDTYIYFQQKYQQKRINKTNHQSNLHKKNSRKLSNKIAAQSEQDSQRKCLLKGRKPEFPEMEKKLIAWIEKMCLNNARITQAIIRNRAMIIINEHRYEANGFRASKGWMEKFFKRHKYICQLLSRNNKLRSAQYIEDDYENVKDQQSEGQRIYEE